MSIWKLMEYPQAKRKKVYYKDKQFVRINDIPANIFKLLDTEKEIDDSTIKVLEAGWRGCVFCEGQGIRHRLVNLQTVYLCDMHYYSTTIGQIAEQLRGEGTKHEKGNEQIDSSQASESGQGLGQTRQELQESGSQSS